MKKAFLANILVLVLLFCFFGCAGMRAGKVELDETDECSSRDPEVEKELRETKQAIDKARLSGADKNCPKAYREVIYLWDEAVELNREDNFKGAIAKARAARENANRLCPDSDGDGVPDEMDKCPNTPAGIKVDTRGCPIDTDGDGVPDSIDKCPNTPKEAKVDAKGCPIDSDGDGVPDEMDKCPNTPRGVKVDASGCPIDSDGDGVPDSIDKCPNTPKGVKVDDKGCPLDSDGDGVPDYLDQCPGTPKGEKVDEVGCWVCKDISRFDFDSLVNFDFDKSNIKPKYDSILDKVADCLKKQTSIKVQIIGHTDNIGTMAYNQTLSEKRASAVLNYFLKKGIAKERFSTMGYSYTKPITSDKTREGRARNRRIQLKLIY